MSSDDEDPRAEGRDSEEGGSGGSEGGSDGEVAEPRSEERKGSFVEDEAHESGSEGGSGDEDDEEGGDEFEKDGFVVRGPRLLPPPGQPRCRGARGVSLGLIGATTPGGRARRG